jgi:hypothetical protein
MTLIFLWICAMIGAVAFNYALMQFTDYDDDN